MTDARIGWGGELQLGLDENASSLTELVEVRSFSLPSDEADEHEVTHLKSPNRRKEFISGLIDAGEVTAQLNYVPGSATDLLLTDAAEDGDTRAVRFIIPDQTGTAVWQITTSGFVKRYSPDNVEANAPITATATIRITGARSQAAETSEALS
jgi:hypothetical protein